MKLINPKEIPAGNNIKKISIIPTLLEKIPKGQTAVIESNDKEYKIPTIRSFLTKQAKKGNYKNYTVVQRMTTDNSTVPPTKKPTLYITNEAKKA